MKTPEIETSPLGKALLKLTELINSGAPVKFKMNGVYVVTTKHYLVEITATTISIIRVEDWLTIHQFEERAWKLALFFSFVEGKCDPVEEQEARDARSNALLHAVTQVVNAKQKGEA